MNIILDFSWLTPPEFSQYVTYYPPDKSRGYAQKTLRELHVIDQYFFFW